MSEMFSLAKRFLSYNYLENDFFELKLRLLKELNSRNTYKIFESELNRIETSIKYFQIRNSEYFYQMYKLKELASDFYSYKNRLSVKREHNKIIENILSNFLISLLDSYYEITSDATEFRLNIDLYLVSFIDDYVNQNKNIINPVVIIYYNIFMLSYRKEQSYYIKLLELKREYLHILDDHGKHRIFEALGNYCINRYQQGDINYYKDAFRLINDEIKSGVRFNRKEFSEIFFTNKVEIAAKLKEYNWAENFIRHYSDRLSPAQREDIINFSYSIIEFEKKNYTASMKYLSKINFDNPILKFRVRNYMLLNYFELNYYDSAYSLIDSYTHLLKKDDKVETSRKERYTIFLNFCQKLLGMKSGYKEIEKEILKKDIEKNSVFMKQWLLEKVDEL